ncbi:hypothetical protein HHJ49_00065 [Escherichia coli]|nr:hypothetical protein HHJ49_00065 [Escherichia coli]
MRNRNPKIPYNPVRTNFLVKQRKIIGISLAFHKPSTEVQLRNNPGRDFSHQSNQNAPVTILETPRQSNQILLNAKAKICKLRGRNPAIPLLRIRIIVLIPRLPPVSSPRHHSFSGIFSAAGNPSLLLLKRQALAFWQSYEARFRMVSSLDPVPNSNSIENHSSSELPFHIIVPHLDRRSSR